MTPHPRDPLDTGPSSKTALEALRKENAAHCRAMPLQRLIDNGMTYDDARALHEAANQPVPWRVAAEELGDRHSEFARKARADGFLESTREHLLRACACFRFAQSVFTSDTDERRSLYRKVIRSFADATALMTPLPRKIEVPFGGGVLCGWLLRPLGIARPPVVLIFGGADGWRESYYPPAQFFLERRMAVCLLDGPGQGESRLFYRVFLTEDYPHAFSAVISHLRADDSLASVGIFGNSLGGTLAAGVAIRDARIGALCVNGGSARPVEVLERFPRFLERLAAMGGVADPERARALLESLALSELEALRCPLLVVHGGADTIFRAENARSIHDRAGSSDRRFVFWDDGDHCLYNHAFERNCLVADWFSRRLAS
jgi:pimeloyl-ACP methyl ester carboxylesterase